MTNGMSSNSAKERENKYQSALKDHRASAADCGSAVFAHWYGS
jgi:hypothetical protein